jgi:TIR domain-containing protein
MPFRVFLTYSLEPPVQALAWRLQTLAAAHGIEMYVPQREGAIASLPGEVPIQSAIDRSDCVLAIITARADASVQRELKYALEKNKLVIPIVQSGFETHPLLARFPQAFTFSPLDNPGTLESKVVEFLKKQNLSKEQQQAIGALVAVGIGLLLLFSLSEK